MRLRSSSAPLVCICLGAYTDCNTIGCWRCPNGVCTQCWQAWGLGATGECQRCNSDGSLGVCSDGSCASGFITQNGGCVPCAEDCAGCDAAGAGKCDSDMCRPGFALSPARNCVPCPRHCHVCSADGSCSDCEPGFGLSAATCVACGSYCNFCSEAGGCDSGGCFPGFSLASDGTCKQCDKPNVPGNPFTRCLACEKLGPGTCDDAELCAGGREKWTGRSISSQYI